MEVARRFRPADAEIEIELTSGAVGAFNLPAFTGLSPSTLVDWAQVISAVLSTCSGSRSLCDLENPNVTSRSNGASITSWRCSGIPGSS